MVYLKYIYFYNTEIGNIGIVADDSSIKNVFFKATDIKGLIEVKETPLLKKAGTQLIEYLSGKRSNFTVPLAPEGTDFQKRVWFSLIGIPYGQTRSYGEIAKRIGNPKAARAVGMANNQNPIPIFIPCHRVIGANGRLTGYAAGLEIKKYLLNLENRK